MKTKITIILIAIYSLAANLNAQTPYLVKDIWAGTGDSQPYGLTNVNGTLFFNALDPVDGAGVLRKSDGTTAGTVDVKVVFPYGYFGTVEKLTAVGNTLYFVGDDASGTTGKELWKSDGTAAGTLMVKDIYPGSSNSSPDKLVDVNGTLFFSANDGINGNELWKSDGTASGTVLVKDIVSGSSGGFASPADLY